MAFFFWVKKGDLLIFSLSLTFKNPFHQNSHNTKNPTLYTIRTKNENTNQRTNFQLHHRNTSERIKEQKVIITASFIYVYKKDSFIDYSLVANDIKNIMINKKFELLEDALLFIKNDLITSYKMKKLRIKITKPDILPDCFVSVSL